MPAPHPERPDVSIRSARPDDTRRLVELLVAGSVAGGGEDPGDLAPYRAAVEEIIASPDDDVLVAESGGSVVGMCQLLVFRHVQAHGGRCAEIESMHVEPARRSQGIGGLLLDAAVRRARDLGCHRVQLTSNRVRTDAHRFYAAHGFAPTHVGFKLVLADEEDEEVDGDAAS